MSFRNCPLCGAGLAKRSASLIVTIGNSQGTIRQSHPGVMHRVPKNGMFDNSRSALPVRLDVPPKLGRVYASAY